MNRKSDQPLVVGIRPEQLRLAGSDTEPNTIVGTVDVVEHLGNEQLAYVRVPGLILPEAAAAARETNTNAEGAASMPTATVRLDAEERVQPGQRVTLAVNTDRLHIFDAITQERLA